MNLNMMSFFRRDCRVYEKLVGSVRQKRVFSVIYSIPFVSIQQVALQVTT